MKRILIGFFVLVSAIAQAKIQVQVEPSQVSLGESLTLTLIQEDPRGGGVPDLTGLEQDFAILGTERNISYSIINGQSQSSSQWTVSLKPLRAGIITIPAIKVGLDKSSPLTINVQGGSAKAQDIQLNTTQLQDVFLLANADQKKPFVNQQVIYTVKVFNSKRLMDVEYQGPQVDDALLIPLGDTKRYQTVQDNTAYVVEEQNYAIFPQKSGSLKITSPTFNALVYAINPQRIKAQDKPIDLEIQPIPKQYKGSTWLPAKQVKLSEQYENTSQRIEQGSTLTRTITIEGNSIPAQLLPTLEFAESDDFKVYPEKGKEGNQIIQGELIGTTEIKVTYLFTSAKKITIPELKLAWFNTTTGKEELAVLPPRSLHITPATTPVNTSNGNPAVSQPTGTVQAPSEPVTSTEKSWPWIISILFAAAWLVTLALWGWQKRARYSGKGQYKAALTELNKACTECNPTKARDALLKWASMHWPDAPLLNLTDLTKLVRDAHLKKQLNLLSKVLYKSGEKTLWRGDELLHSVQALSRTKRKKINTSNRLPPINPF